MNIGFYGHSAACWANFPIYDKVSFIDSIVKHYNATLVNQGVPQGSQERILFDLKKTKLLDLAVIFHSAPQYIFVPKCKRDVCINEVGQRKAFYLWQNPDQHQHALAAIKDDYFSYGGIKETFKDINRFVDTFGLYHEYLHHPDLQMNRFYGALCQVDQYITHKKIATIHVPIKKHMPSWFEFSHGIVAHDVEESAKKYYQPGLPNNISLEGQEIIAQQLQTHIDCLLNTSGSI